MKRLSSVLMPITVYVCLIFTSVILLMVIFEALPREFIVLPIFGVIPVLIMLFKFRIVKEDDHSYYLTHMLTHKTTEVRKDESQLSFGGVLMNIFMPHTGVITYAHHGKERAVWFGRRLHELFN